MVINMNENWKPAPGYEHAYQVSDQGNVRCIGAVIQRRNRKPLTLTTKVLQLSSARKYSMVNLYDATGVNHPVIVHRLVAKAFLQQPAGKTQVNHINGNPKDNRAVNLEWVTPEQNIAHAHRLGLFKHDLTVGNVRTVTLFTIDGQLVANNLTCTATANKLSARQPQVSSTCAENVKRFSNNQRPCTVNGYVPIFTSANEQKIGTWVRGHYRQPCCTTCAPWTPSDVEQWRPVQGWETTYEVSDHGRVRSLPREKTNIQGHRYVRHARILSQSSAKGYKYVTLSTDERRVTVPVHRLVATAFLPNENGLPDVDHLNGQKHDNHVTNLEWVTHQDNCQRARQSCKPSHSVAVTDGEHVWSSMTLCAKELNTSKHKVFTVCKHNASKPKRMHQLHGHVLRYL